jgi:hypothetical protein
MHAMNDRSKPSRDELISRVRDLLEAERVRQASPRGSPEYEAAEAEEQQRRQLVWDLIGRAGPSRNGAADEDDAR